MLYIVQSLTGISKVCRKNLNGHPRVSEQNLLPLNMVWRTREASRHQETPLWKDNGFDPTKTSQHELDPTKPHTTQGREGDSHPPDPTPQGEGHSHPQDPTPQQKGIPTHKTPHHKADPTPQGGKEGPTTTHTRGGGFPDLGGVAGPRSA